jgi:hypothetical protein
MTLGTIALSGANASDFTLGGGCAAGASLSSGGSCAILVTFAPTGAGSRGATLTVTGTLPALSCYESSWNPAITDPVSVTLTATLSGTGVISADNIVIHPTTPSTLYAGLRGAGVYRSADSGANWALTAGQPASTNITALLINKNDPTMLYAGAYGAGVYKSTDSGATWTSCAALSNANVRTLTLDNAGKLYAGTEAGVFVSADACASWAAMSAGLPE